MIQEISPLSLERYELKYLIPVSMVEPISQYVKAYCELDYFSLISPENCYSINSLYLDTPSMYLLRMKESANATSFNMRIRSYGAGTEPPFFFEIKHKIGQFVKKKRARVEIREWARILEEEAIPDSISLEFRKNLEHFLFMKMTYNVEPIILTQYRRKAYISTHDDYARVTFDRDLRCQEMHEWCVSPNNQIISHYDIPDLFGNSGNNVILELKCEKKVPLWMVDMIRYFNLERESFSKFAGSMSVQYGLFESQQIRYNVTLRN